MACLVKNTVLAPNQEDEEYEDWSDDEESELKMEQIAAINERKIQGESSSSTSAVNDVRYY